MSCPALENITYVCENNWGGLKRAIVWDSNDTVSVTENSTTWFIDALTTSENAVEIYLKKDLSNYEEPTTADEATGATTVAVTINVTVLRRSAVKSKAIKIMGDGQRELDVIVQDRNDNYWYFPKCVLTSVNGGSGTAKADGSQYQLVFTAINKTLAKQVDEDIIPTLFTVS